MLYSALNKFVPLNVLGLPLTLRINLTSKIKVLRTGDLSDWSNFKKLRNEANYIIKNEEKSYYYNTFDT